MTGRCQRVAIVRAIIVDPRVLLADEPGSILDTSTRVRIIDLFAEFGERRRLSLVVASHDLTVVAALCRQTVVLERGRIVEQGPTRDVLRAPGNPCSTDVGRRIRAGIVRPRPDAALLLKSVDRRGWRGRV